MEQRLDLMREMMEQERAATTSTPRPSGGFNIRDAKDCVMMSVAVEHLTLIYREAETDSANM